MEFRRSFNKWLLQYTLSGVLLFVVSATFSQEKATGKYGANDTLIVPFIIYNGDTIPARTLENCWVLAPMPPAMRARMREWTRLRNAVYVTYPYARKAGAVMNDVNFHLATMKSKEERKNYLKTREK